MTAFLREGRGALFLLALGTLTAVFTWALVPQYGETFLFGIANVSIMLGYLYVVVRVAPYFKVDANAKIGAIAFFFTCALTHLHQAVHAFTNDNIMIEDLGSLHMLLIHTPQAFAIWLFVIGLRRSAITPPPSEPV